MQYYLPPLTPDDRVRQTTALPTADWTPFLESAASWLELPHEVAGHCQLIDGKISLATFAAGRATSVKTAREDDKYGVITFHTHPDSSPPSLMDLAHAYSAAANTPRIHTAVLTKGKTGRPTALLFVPKPSEAKITKKVICKMLEVVEASNRKNGGNMQQTMRDHFDIAVHGDAQNDNRSRQTVNQIIPRLCHAGYLPLAHFMKSPQFQAVLIVMSISLYLMKMQER